MKKTNLSFWTNLIISFLFASAPLSAQKVFVKNVGFVQEGDRIVVNYDLVGNQGKKYFVTLSGSDNSGKTYNLELVTVSGDVGKGVNAGYGKKIIWNMAEDYPRGLEGEDFVFKVDAVAVKGKSKWPWIVAAGVAGGVVYFVTKGGKTDKSDKASVVIQMPDSF